MLGVRRESVKFRIHKSVMGIGRSRYQDGVLQTKINSEIAMLRRLPDNHVEEILPEVVEELPWAEIRNRTIALGKYENHMTKELCLAALNAPLPGVQIA